jgi:hypothetical protein
VINAPQLLADLTRQLKRLEDDLRQRHLTAREQPDLDASLRAEWQAARDADRCAETFETWADQIITQAGVHWLLSCVFLRFIEDNQLVDRPWLGGTPESGRLALARDRHESYFQVHPLQGDRDYLLTSFREAGALPGLRTFFDPLHNPVFRIGISGDAAMALRQFWQQIDPNTGALKHDFTDATWNTRFLGDLYQDLSEATRKRYALLQTPEFVEAFILDRTLTPAIHEFGFREMRMIDPTCGSGHFLLGGFHRLVAEWQRHEPGRNPVDIAQKALDAVAGVDLNPFAIAISRFRLLVAALQASGTQRLSEAHNFRVSVAIGDSLLHGTRFGLTETQSLFDTAASHADTGLAHAYASEDLVEVQRILGRQYHAVVGNPPYIVVKDAALNAAYRLKYASCHMKYSLGAPFTERFFELALSSSLPPPLGEGGGGGARSASAGYVGLITANSFMKREFGSKLIEQVLPRLDLTHVVDTSGAYIPGHGTPTVILFGRHRAPVDDSVRTVMGIKGEPSAPDDPAKGVVWSAIVGQLDQAGSESDFVSVADISRATFAKHPWSIGGGGAADAKEQIEVTRSTLGELVESIGFASFTGTDEVFNGPASAFRRKGFPEQSIRTFVLGDAVRDYQIGADDFAFAPYHEDLSTYMLEPESPWGRAMWPYRASLEGVISFAGKTRKECGDQWWAWYRWVPSKYRNPLTITFAEVATHNHFVLDRGDKVFKQTAPVIKLPAGSSEDDHLGLLGLLNSSVACFWLKQVCFPKGGDHVGNEGARVRKTLWDERFAFNATNVAEFPLCTGRPLDIATRIDVQARQLSDLQPAALLVRDTLPTRASLNAARDQAAELQRLMIARQEELDWRCYRLYQLLPAEGSAAEVEFHAPVEVALGERAFEIALARRIAAGTEQTTWFERHGSQPITDIPAHWPEAYRQVVARRIELIERDKTIGLIERPEFKRRWNSPKWEDLEQAALREWLLARLEAPALWPASADRPPQITSTARLADAVQPNADFMQVAALYAGHADFDLHQLVAELVAPESVPLLPAQRYTDTGLRKRDQWETIWALQRAEDAGEEVGKIPVPPKYQSKDFLKTDFWRLRGGLDVCKERWVSYPGCERGADGSLPITWAGWNHLQQATALAGYYVDMKDTEGWEPTRLQPLLAGLLELVPWLEQWHNELDPVFGERMGSYYKGFVSEEARALGVTIDDLRAWKPAPAAVKRGRKLKS